MLGEGGGGDWARRFCTLSNATMKKLHFHVYITISYDLAKHFTLNAAELQDVTRVENKRS